MRIEQHLVTFKQQSYQLADGMLCVFRVLPVIINSQNTSHMLIQLESVNLLCEASTLAHAGFARLCQQRLGRRQRH